MNNEMHLQFPAKSINESFARLVIIGFIAPLDPNAQELNEIKTIVSEGVTNAIIHGYELVEIAFCQCFRHLSRNSTCPLEGPNIVMKDRSLDLTALVDKQLLELIKGNNCNQSILYARHGRQ